MHMGNTLKHIEILLSLTSRCPVQEECSDWFGLLPGHCCYTLAREQLVSTKFDRLIKMSRILPEGLNQDWRRL